MSQDDQITVRGFVTAEPKLWQSAPGQAPVATIRVGSTRRRLNRETGEWQDGETSYYDVKCWRRLAENVHGSLRKGDMVLVRGKVFTRNWLDDQQRVRTEVQIEADSVGHDLAFGWSRFNRGVHIPPGAMKDLADGEAARHDMAPDPEPPGDTGFDGFDGDGGAGLPPAPAAAAPGDGDHGYEPADLAGLASGAGQPADAPVPF